MNSVPNPPAGFWRGVLLIESLDYDQWIRIAANDGPPRTLCQNIDFAVVRIRDEHGAALQPKAYSFSGDSRRLEGRGRWEHEGLGSDFLLNRRAIGHPSGLRSMIPEPAIAAPEDRETPAYLQNELDSAPLTTFEGDVDWARRGPIIVPAATVAHAAVLTHRSAAHLSAAAQVRVAEAINCSNRHDGEIRGIQVPTTDPRQVNPEIVNAPGPARIPHPAGMILTEPERRALADCVRVEYQRQLRALLSAGLKPLRTDRRPRGTDRRPASA